MLPILVYPEGHGVSVTTAQLNGTAKPEDPNIATYAHMCLNLMSRLKAAVQHGN